MTLLTVGVNHHSAPHEVLESLAAADRAALAVDALASRHVAESMVVSTCNRVEVYAEVDRFHAAVEELTATLAKAGGMTVGDLTAQCYVHYEERAAQHLFEVASGLNSMVIGEQQIMAQLRAALTEAQELGTAGRELNEIAQAALRVGKRVRSETALDRAGANVVSVAYAEACDRLRRLAGLQPHDLRMVVVGAGSMSGLALAHAARLGVSGVTVVSRTEHGADRLANAYDADAAHLERLPELIARTDLLVCCTGAAGTVIDYETVAAAMAGRPDWPLVIVDLAVPHDTDPDTALIPGVTRIDLAALAERPETRADQTDTVAAARIVADELRQFFAARSARAVEPVLVSLRARASALVDTELQRLRERLPQLPPSEWAAIEQGLRRTVNTLMHTPTVRIKELATDPDGQRYAHALSSLFDLSVDLVDTVVLPRDERQAGELP